MDTQSTLPAALALASRGYRVFPAPQTIAQPHLTGWNSLAASDPDPLARLFEGSPHYGLGVMCGDKGGVMVVDVDVADGKPGLASLKVVEKKLGSLGEPTARSGSGGLHYYFRYDPKLSNQATMIGAVAEGIDILGSGPGASFVYAPPSRRDKDSHDGPYAWTAGLPPKVDDLRPLPDRWRRQLREHARTRGKAIAPFDPRLESPKQGQQNDLLYGAGLYLRLRGADDVKLRAYLDDVASRCDPEHPARRVQSVFDSLTKHVDPIHDTDADRELLDGIISGDRVITHDPPGLLKALDLLGYSVRANELRTAAELTEFRLPGSADWIVFDAHRRATLKESIRAGLRFKKLVATAWDAVPAKFTRTDFDDAVLWAADANRVNPPAQYLADLPKWDGVARVDTILEDVFPTLADASEADRRFIRWASRYLFMGFVERTLRPGCEIHTVPVLIGPEAAGKSSVVKASCPDPAWYGNSVKLHEPLKKQLEAMTGKIVIELEEMDGVRSKRAADAIKTLLSSDTDQQRMAYGHESVEHIRRSIFIGTSNTVAILPNEPGGNRRFVPIEVGQSRADPRTIIEPIRDQLYAEALHRVNAGERTQLPYDLVKSVIRRNERFRQADETVNGLLQSWMDRMTDTERLLAYGVHQIREGARITEQARHVTDVALAKELKALSWRRPPGSGKRRLKIEGKSSPRYVWLPPKAPDNARVAVEKRGQFGKLEGFRPPARAQVTDQRMLVGANAA